jgi:hypothetical protein
MRGRGDHAPTPQDDRVNDSEDGGRVRVGRMRARAGGRSYHAPTLLEAGEVILIFWVLRWKMRGMKLSAIGEGATQQRR